MGIVPNYTTNGITIANDDEYSKELLRYTADFCGGVAVSANAFSTDIWLTWNKAVQKLLNTDVYTNLHIIIGEDKSIDYLDVIYRQYGDNIHTYVLLPMMPEGRSSKFVTEDVFNKLKLWFKDVKDKTHFAFGANFYPYLLHQGDDNRIECSMYEPESFSKNLILGDTIRITPSSFNRKTTLFEMPYDKTA